MLTCTLPIRLLNVLVLYIYKGYIDTSYSVLHFTVPMLADSPSWATRRMGGSPNGRLAEWATRQSWKMVIPLRAHKCEARKIWLALQLPTRQVGRLAEVGRLAKWATRRVTAPHCLWDSHSTQCSHTRSTVNWERNPQPGRSAAQTA